MERRYSSYCVLTVFTVLLPFGVSYPMSAPPGTVRVAACQMTVLTDLNANLAKMDSWAGLAAAAGAQICVFPEWSDLGDAFVRGGYTGPAVQPLPGTTSAAIGNIARRHNLWIVTAIWEAVPGGVYDTLIFIDNSGTLVSKQRKNFVGGAFNAGDAFPSNFLDAEAVPSPWGPLSGMVCADLGDAQKRALFPEVQPALMICVFANGPADYVALCPSLAALCGCPLVGVNVQYTDGSGGKSLFTDASGAILWQAGSTAEVLKTWDVAVNPASNRRPQVDPGETQTVRLPANSVTLRGVVTDDGLPSGTLTTTWSKVSGPGTVSFGNASALSTSAQFSAAGVYGLRLTANDGAASRSRNVFINVLPASGDLNLVGHWTFENSAADGSGMGNHGTVTGSAAYSTDVPSGVSGTRSLDLSGGYVEVPHSASLNATDSATIACWFKPLVSYPGFVLNGGNDFSALLNKGTNWGWENYSLAYGRYWPLFGRGVGVSRNGTLSKASLTAGVWFHAAVVLDSHQRQGRLYINGVLDHLWITGPGTDMTNTDPLYIGIFRPGPGTSPVKGKIDDVRLYTRALADEEIAALVPGAQVNQAPVVGAGSNLTVTLPAAASLQGTYVDDGWPATSAIAKWTSWSKVSGPGDVSFSNRFALSTTARFSLPGRYVLELRGTDGAHRSYGTVTVQVNSATNTPPIAVCSASPTSGTAPLAVSFNGGGSSDPDGAIVSYAWAFGDGTTGTGSAPGHVYASAGTYTATLTVTDAAGATGTASVTVTVTSPGLPPSTLTAVFLGVTGEDRVGPGNQAAPNGIADYHISISGLRGSPAKVTITSDTGGIWETPYNGTNWIVDVQGSDLWFEPWSSTTFHVKVTYADGSTDQVDATNPAAPPPAPASPSSSHGGNSGCGATGLEALLLLGLLGWMRGKGGRS